MVRIMAEKWQNMLASAMPPAVEGTPGTMLFAQVG
jgi:hypothetical protein